jgi:hypothetical protein
MKKYHQIIYQFLYIKGGKNKKEAGCLLEGKEYKKNPAWRGSVT